MSANLPDSVSQSMTQTSEFAKRLRNFVVVMVAIALSTAIFLGMRTATGTASLEAMAETAVPLDVAKTNGKPLLIEFYANWCTTCQAMAPDMDSLRATYGDRVNFVMLNVDNTKWLPEVLEYRVDGIPHFVFMGADGTAIASAIGEQPRTIMAANLESLIAGQALPYAKIDRGATSEVEIPTTSSDRPDDPRSHGAQVR